MTRSARKIVESRARSALRLSRAPQLGVGFPSYDTKIVAMAPRSPTARVIDTSSHTQDRKMRYESALRNFWCVGELEALGVEAF